MRDCLEMRDRPEKQHPKLTSGFHERVHMHTLLVHPIHANTQTVNLRERAGLGGCGSGRRGVSLGWNSPWSLSEQLQKSLFCGTENLTHNVQVSN